MNGIASFGGLSPQFLAHLNTQYYYYYSGVNSIVTCQRVQLEIKILLNREKHLFSLAK